LALRTALAFLAILVAGSLVLALLSLWVAPVTTAPLTPDPRTRYEEMLARAQSRLAAHPADLEAKWVLGHALADLRRFDESERTFREVLDTAREQRDSRLQVLGYDGLARVARQTGEPESALPLLRQALEIAVDSRDSEWQTKVRGNIAYAELKAGRPDKARPVFGELLHAYRAAGKHHEAAIAATQLGELELRAGNVAVAERYFRIALEEAEVTGREGVLQMARENLEIVLGTEKRAR